MSSEKLYAFYSKTQEKKRSNKITKIDSNGKPRRNIKHHIYESVSGKEVLVTCVAKDPNYVLNFKDVVSLGEVKRWVRNVYW